MQYLSRSKGPSTLCGLVFLISSTDLFNQTLEYHFNVHSVCSCRYSVFGLGSRLYPNFCAFGHYVDEQLRELGAQTILSMGEGDEQNGQEESFKEWAKNVFKVSVSEKKG